MSLISTFCIAWAINSNPFVHWEKTDPKKSIGYKLCLRNVEICTGDNKFKCFYYTGNGKRFIITIKGVLNNE